MAVVYILKCANGRYYVGSTNDFTRRYEEHTEGWVKATKNIRPVEVKFVKEVGDIAKARKIEYHIKLLKRRDIIKNIIDTQELHLIKGG